MDSRSENLVGVIANPAAGKDVRRLVSAASPVSDMAKIGIVRRVLIGALEGGADRVLVGDDHRSFGRNALADLDADVRSRVEIVGADVLPTGLNSRIMAATLSELGVGALVVLGGDGTHRDVVKGWRDAVLVPVSTGTNNVFPRAIEATIAGHAAAVAAAAQRDPERLASISHRAKLLELTMVSSQPDPSRTGRDPGATSPGDLALIDIALISSLHVGSRAVWDPSVLRELVVTTAEVDSIGLSSIAARLQPIDRREPGALHVRFGGAVTVRAPIAPGLYRDIDVAGHRRLGLGDSVRLAGPGVLVFDGERDVVLGAGQIAHVSLANDGPLVVDPAAALSSSARV